MQANPYDISLRPRLNEKDFARISEYIEKNVGIRLPLSKLILVESRLIKRILKLNITNFSEYVNYVFSKDGIEEQEELIDFICTNKTDFFREDYHFKFLTQHLLSKKTSSPVNVWSAACSSGEEPYTISIVLEELKAQGIAGNYNILATDISSTILQKAIKGEFSSDKYAAVPAHLQRKYFKIQNGSALTADSIRRNVTFKKFNLIDDASYLSVNKSFDFIFCRNVLIYFDHAMQTKVIQNLLKKLVPGGILFLGHSETLMGRNLNLVQLQPTIYQKPYA